MARQFTSAGPGCGQGKELRFSARRRARRLLTASDAATAASRLTADDPPVCARHGCSEIYLWRCADTACRLGLKRHARRRKLIASVVPASTSHTLYPVGKRPRITPDYFDEVRFFGGNRIPAEVSGSENGSGGGTRTPDTRIMIPLL